MLAVMAQKEVVMLSGPGRERASGDRGGGGVSTLLTLLHLQYLTHQAGQLCMVSTYENLAAAEVDNLFGLSTSASRFDTYKGV